MDSFSNSVVITPEKGLFSRLSTDSNNCKTVISAYLSES
jgi:hypothetical protein